MRDETDTMKTTLRRYRLYVFLVLLFAVSNFLFHLRLGKENLEDHSVYACLWTATGWPSMFLTRVVFENGSFALWPILPLGLVNYALFWTPMLFAVRDRPWYWRTALMQLAVLVVYIVGHVALGPLTYHFYA